ncbi:MerR family transcriptional regulator [Lacticaseibacillus pabuli]|uniref:MerR family transcriptional regulator n=1 Tax=Lacticaseibacillus pabuli TaxID=3025672 RepID=A0ABY7WSC6_9LACO|nr:MerR family transcriptional regulator [Lacticaseibacillus sp. KACC 23028]WDF82699.1 MerR family transcriptional regulator [Lacticaseibacillus sp. KACC 23028]
MEQDLTHIFKQLDLSVGIGETSRVTGATLTQIRYWEKKGLIQSFTRDETRNKRFDLPNIMAILQIRHLLSEGYTLAKATEMLKNHRHDVNRFKMLARTAIKRVWDGEDGSTYFDMGVIANDPDYNVQIKLTDNDAVTTKVPRETTTD